MLIKEDPSNYRGITLLSVMEKVFCLVLNERLVNRGQVLHERQWVSRCCVDNIYTFRLNEELGRQYGR